MTLAVAFSNANASAETFPLSCPTEIMTQQQINTPPAGWEASVDVSLLSPQQGHSLHSVGFYSGPPAERALLAPDETKGRGKKFISSWTLQPAKEKYWLACNYQQTKLILSKQLPDRPLRCEAHYEGESLVPTNLTCRTPGRQTATRPSRPGKAPRD